VEEEVEQGRRIEIRDEDEGFVVLLEMHYLHFDLSQLASPEMQLVVRKKGIERMT
jgi:hypothetical protein